MLFRSVTWDIYSHQLNLETKQYITDLNSAHVNLKGEISYDNLPVALADYHVGVILYKGLSKNYIYNEPNKYFEYYVSGLDVWYPKEMTGMKANKQTANKPFVLELDFNDLPDDLLQKALQPGLFSKVNKYIAENVFDNLLLHIDANRN